MKLIQIIRLLEADYFHGTTQSSASKIEKDKKLFANMPKKSGGTRDEVGLIWVTSEKDLAKNYALGWEQMDHDEPGKIFKVKVPGDLKIIDRHHKLSSEQAEILNGLSKRPHDPILPGMELDRAMYKIMLHQDAPQSYAEILPVLGYNALLYNKTHLGILKKELDILDAEDVTKD